MSTTAHFHKIDARKRHVAKTISWRIVGTIDTFLLSSIITGNPNAGLEIGFSEFITKLLLYYLHERIWFKIVVKNSRLRHLFKTLTWRFLGTLDTIIISWILTGSLNIGLKIGSVEVITKMILFYFHERVWHRTDWGITKKQ